MKHFFYGGKYGSKNNKEIRNYTEHINFGLNFRQFIFSTLGFIMVVVLFFLLKPFFGIVTLSWICIFGVVPFAAIGFVKYNGMSFEQFVIAYIKSEILTPRNIVIVLIFRLLMLHFKKSFIHMEINFGNVIDMTKELSGVQYLFHGLLMK